MRNSKALMLALEKKHHDVRKLDTSKELNSLDNSTGNQETAVQTALNFAKTHETLLRSCNEDIRWDATNELGFRGLLPQNSRPQEPKREANIKPNSVVPLATACGPETTAAMDAKNI